MVDHRDWIPKADLKDSMEDTSFLGGEGAAFLHWIQVLRL